MHKNGFLREILNFDILEENSIVPILSHKLFKHDEKNKQEYFLFGNVHSQPFGMCDFSFFHRRIPGDEHTICTNISLCIQTIL